VQIVNNGFVFSARLVMKRYLRIMQATDVWSLFLVPALTVSI